MSPEEMERKLNELLDRQAVEDVLRAYTRGIDRFDQDLIRRAYHESALDDHGAFVGGRDEFFEWATGMLSTRSTNHQHHLSNITTEFDGETAHAESYFISVTVTRQGQPLAMVGGRYVDRLEKEDGVWSIHARVILTDWVLPGVNTREAVAEEDGATKLSHLPAREQAVAETRPMPRRDRTDLSYARPLHVSDERVRLYREAGQQDSGS